MSHLQKVFEGLCADLGFDSQSSEEAERIWDALRAVSGLFQYGPLVKLAESLSCAVIANELKPGDFDHEVWERALLVCEELKLVEHPHALRPLKFHYTMRDALWELP